MHPFLRKPLPALSAKDILALIAAQVDESQQLEYKRELRLGTEGERKEAAKDASGMANGGGGYLIYGIAEKQLPDARRVPVEASPIEDGGLPARLEEVLAAVVRPRLGVQTRLIDTDGGYFLVAAIQRHGPGLHMVQGWGEHRYYMRTGLSTRPMDEHEVAAAYRAEEDEEERVLRRLRGLPLVARIDDAELGPQPDWYWPHAWCGVVAAPLGGPRRPFDSLGIEPSDLPEPAERFVGKTAIRRDPWAFDSAGYADEDAEVYDSHPSGVKLSHHYDPPELGKAYLGPTGPLRFLKRRVRLFRTGVCEWGRTYSKEFTIPARTLAEDVHDALAYFASVYGAVGYFGDVRVWVVGETVAHTYLGVHHAFGPPSGRNPNAPRLQLTQDTRVDALLADPMSAVRPAMDYVWQAYGWPRCLLFTDGVFSPLD